MQEEGPSTRVTLLTDLDITGKPAQFGRGVMADVAGKLADQFAACLARASRRPGRSRRWPGQYHSPGGPREHGARWGTRRCGAAAGRRPAGSRLP